MATRAYDRSIEDIERAKFEESRYGSGSYGYNEPAWGRQGQSWSQPGIGGYAQSFSPQFGFNPLYGQGSMGFYGSPQFGTFPFAQYGLNPWAQIDPFFSRQYNQPFGGPFGQQFAPHSATPINPLLQFSPFAPTGNLGFGQSPYGLIDLLQQLRQLQMSILGLAMNQPFIPGLSQLPQFQQQYGQPFQTQTPIHPLEALRLGTQQTELARPFGISRNVRRGPRGYKRPDELIRDDISERIALHPYLDATNCEVTVKDGEVTIRGTVDDRISKSILEEVVESVFGVKDVIVDVRVGQPVEGMREQEMVGTKAGREK